MSNAATHDIAVLGECMLELSVLDDLSNPAHNAAALNNRLSYGGDTLNTALYLSRLGIQVSYATALGNDALSHWMRQQWLDEGIDCSLVAMRPDALPGIYAIETDANGERSFHYWRDNSAVRGMLATSVLREKLFAQLRHFPMIYFSGITLSLFETSEVDALLDFLADYRRAGGRLAFDSNYRPARWPDTELARTLFDRSYSLCDIALSTLDDERLLYPDADTDMLVARLRRLGVGEIVIKNGAEGCRVITAEHTRQFAASAVSQVTDTTAAGDSFNAAYLAARLQGLDTARAAAYGNRLAGIVVQQPGAIIPRAAMTDMVNAALLQPPLQTSPQTKTIST